MSGDENLMWDEDQSWSFPKEEDNNPKEEEKAATGGAKDENHDRELMPPPRPPRPYGRGKKRNAAGGKTGTRRKGGGKSGGGGGGGSEHELHIWTERERRKKMRNMFANLHALIPHLPQKADKSTIVDEAVQYIKKMQQRVQNLRKQKLEKLRFKEPLTSFARSVPNSYMNNPNLIFNGGPDQYLLQPSTFKTWTSPNVILNVTGREAHISVCGLRKPGLFAAICFVMDKYKIEVVSAQISSDQTRSMFMIHTHAKGGSEMFPFAFQVEEMYKQAAAEIVLWVNS